MKKYKIIALTPDSSGWPDDVGTVHLEGSHADGERLACGYDKVEFKLKITSEPINCTTCKHMLAWAKQACKIKS